MTVVDCQWSVQPNDLGKFACVRCGFAVKDRSIRMNCTIAQAAPLAPHTPPLLKRLRNFSVAAIGHALAGFPTADQATIDARLAICHGCELYKADPENPNVGTCMHSSCGCPLTSAEGYVSKLAWADQECPIGKWGRAD